MSAAPSPSEPIQRVWREPFSVRVFEIGADGRVGPAMLCDFLQETAGNHARHLGFDIAALQREGRTWMLSRMRLKLVRQPEWHEALSVETWPAGLRGRLIAMRAYRMHDAQGALLLEGLSDWLYVDVATRRICRVPERLTQFVPEDRPVPQPDERRVPELEAPAWSVELPVRHSDLDINQHVNNVRYVEWLFEPLPPEFPAGRHVIELDILYRQAAEHGDVAVSQAAPEGEDALLHRIVRRRDGAVLALARTRWHASVAGA